MSPEYIQHYFYSNPHQRLYILPVFFFNLGIQPQQSYPTHSIQLFQLFSGIKLDAEHGYVNVKHKCVLIKQSNMQS